MEYLNYTKMQGLLMQGLMFLIFKHMQCIINSQNEYFVMKIIYSSRLFTCLNPISHGVKQDLLKNVGVVEFYYN